MKNPANLRLIAITLMLTSPVGCTSATAVGDGSASPAAQVANAAVQAPATRPWSFPTGLHVDSKIRGSYKNVGGVYPGVKDPDPSCCWIGPKTQIDVISNADANQLSLQVYVPDIPLFRSKGQSLGVTVGHLEKRFDNLTPGLHTLSLDFRNAAKDKSHLEVLLTSRAFVPAEEHINGDTRRLSLILLKAETKSS